MYSCREQVYLRFGGLFVLQKHVLTRLHLLPPFAKITDPVLRVVVGESVVSGSTRSEERERERSVVLKYKSRRFKRCLCGDSIRNTRQY